MKIRLVRFVLAVAALAVAAAVIGGLLLIEAPASNREALFLALGIVLNLPVTAFAFYFGSTEQSERSASGAEPLNSPEEGPLP